MGGLRFLYRLMGSLWTLLGVIGTVICAFILFISRPLASSLGNSLNIHIAVEPARIFPALMGLFFCIFLIYYGTSLLGMKNWTRTIGIAFHITLGMILLTLTAIIFVNILPTAFPNGNSVNKTFAILLPLIGLALSGGLMFLGWQLSTRAAVDVFTGQTSIHVPPHTVECPTCHEQMDVISEKCPNCDDPDKIPPIVRASLVDMQNGKEIPVLLRKLTHIGRDNPSFEIQFDDPTVSSNHALIEYIDGQFYLHGQSDINGTFVNETLVHDAIIQNNDILRFGRAKAKFLTFTEGQR